MNEQTVDHLRVLAWADYLHVSTHELGFSEAERRLFDSERFRTSKAGHSVRPGTLRRWMAGTAPNRVTLERMGRRVPGSLELFDHPLWQIVKSGTAIHPALLLPLATSVRGLMFEERLESVVGAATLVQVTPKLIHDLQRIPSVDGLAGLAYCARKAYEEEEYELGFEALQAFYRLGLTLGIFRPMWVVTGALLSEFLADFSLNWAAAAWLPSRSLRRITDDLRWSLMAKIVLEGQAKPAIRTWPETVGLIAEWVDRDAASQRKFATSLCLLLDPTYASIPCESGEEERRLGELAIKELCNLRIDWEVEMNSRHKRRITVTEGMRAGDTYEDLIVPSRSRRTGPTPEGQN